MLNIDGSNSHSDSPKPTSLIPELGRKTSFTSSTSSSGDEAFNEHVQLVIEHARLILKKLQSKRTTASAEDELNSSRKRSVSFGEVTEIVPKTSYDNLEPVNISNSYASQKIHPISPTEDSEPCKTEFDGWASGKNGELIDSVETLIHLLAKSQEQVKQLKFKNFMLTAGLKDSDSRFEVEKNLNKQQFERIKCQLILDSQDLIEKLRVQDLKITKYKDKIIEKNKEINKLMRILNESAVPNPQSTTDDSQMVKKPRISREEKSRKDSNMLATLGMLASHVLNESHENATNLDNTESDISHDSVSNQNNSNLPKAQHFLSMPVLPEARSSSLTPTSDNSTPKQSFQLPRLRSFSTVDGTVKDSN